MIKLLERPLLALFPRRCAYCGKPIAPERHSCRACEAELPRITGDICLRCGRESEFCACRGAAAYYDSLAAPFYYEGCVRRGIHAYKFRRNPRSAEAFGAEMARAVRSRYPAVEFDIIVSVPMTKRSLRDRGYDQCALLAQRLSDELGVPYSPNAIVKLYETEKQHGLSYYLRKGNLTGVFDIPQPELVKDKCVLLCDDISTSGETMNECAKMLWLCGAREIRCIALALPKNKKKKK